jgi:agmatinase
MNCLPPNATHFIGASSDQPLAGSVALLGVCYDGTTSFRPGTRGGPDGLRAVSEDGIETYSPRLDRDLTEVTFADLGNLEIPHGAPGPVVEAACEAARELFQAGALPVILGGEHSISPGPIRAALEHHPDLVVVQFDAHADLREKWNGSSQSHACAMRRVLDFLPPDRLLQVGIRSGTREEFAEMRQANRLVRPLAKDLRAALARFDAAPIYLTFDLDFFDPSLVPGTGTPEAGGSDWATCEDLLDVFREHRLVACDLVELAPGLDSTQISSCVAAKLLRELILLLDSSQ